MKNRYGTIDNFGDVFGTGENLMSTLSKWIDFQELRNLSEVSINNNVRCVNRFNEYLLLNDENKVNDINTIKEDDISSYLVYLKHTGKKASSINFERKCLLAFFNFAKKKKFVKNNPVEGIPKLKEDHQVKHAVTENEFRKQIENLDLHYFNNIVTFVLLHVLYYTGARISSISALNVQDINFDKNEIVFNKAKSRSAYTVSMHPALSKCLQSYINVRGKTENTDALLLTMRNQRCTIRTLQVKVENVAKDCGLENISCHSYRRSLATRLLENGTDLLTIQRILNHKSLHELLKYVQVSDKKMKSELDKLL